MWSRTSRLYYLYELGRWDELLSEADDVIAWDRHQGGSTQIEVMSLIACAPVRAQRGCVDDARRDAAAFLPRAREVADPQALIPALAQGAFSFAAAGELDGAVALVEEFERIGVYVSGGFSYPVLPTLLRICVAAGEHAWGPSPRRNRAGRGFTSAPSFDDERQGDLGRRGG